ncbi:MAG: 50S ribosomal protein L31 [Elusimicrobia bacterium GWA2_62_23]|nr:MAG: 50S ribosomal protein L31 [Elusimicrobia bacterium GWA2_62_23]OGR68817.1 MAG: 50S ribosomal protein L31 [Elusimicrobia bacterium GWC2_63_65]
MKNDIHPSYNLCEVSCVCGNTFKTRSVKPAIKVEICSACHPFYTGKQKLLDTAGRVEKFNTKFAATGGKMVERKAKKAAVKAVSPRHTVKRKLSSAAVVAKKDEKAPAKAAAPKAEKKAETK